MHYAIKPNENRQRGATNIQLKRGGIGKNETATDSICFEGEGKGEGCELPHGIQGDGEPDATLSYTASIFRRGTRSG